MANIFELSNNKKGFTALQNLKAEFENTRKEELRQYKEKEECKYRNSHIFKTHIEALDYMKDNCKCLQWFGDDVIYDPHADIFIVYGQTYDINDIPCNYKIHRTYDEMIEQYNKHIANVNSRYEKTDPSKVNKWQYDDNGYLKYIYK